MKYKHLFVQNTFSSQQFVILASIIKFSKKNYFEFSVIYPKTLDDSQIEYLFNKIKSQNENILPKKKSFTQKNIQVPVLFHLKNNFYHSQTPAKKT